MIAVKRVVLDVLKPHEPNALEFARRLAGADSECKVRVTVTEMDEKTETLVVVIEGRDIDFEAIENTMTSMGASLHSIDEVDVSHGEQAGGSN
jgi:hypothetical protein